MTDWLRVLGWTVVSGLIALGLLATGWIVLSRRKLSQFRFSDQQQNNIKASRVGWWGDQKQKSDQSRVDRKS